VNERDFVSGPSRQKTERQRVKDIVVNDSFVPLLRKSIAMLSPIDALIVKYQSDSVPISEVLVDFRFTLLTSFESLKSSDIITEDEHQYLVTLCKQRYEFLYGEAHGLAYLLDPRYMGEKLSQDARTSLEDVLFNITDDSCSDPGEKVSLFQQYTEFVISARSEKTNKTFRYDMLMRKIKTSYQYWLSDGSQWPLLQNIALRLFSLATSTASCERSFSSQGFIHSKLRNSLHPARVEKLMFIKTNFTQLQDTLAPGIEWSSEDDGASDDQAEEIE
jgi:hypothetical protein